MNPNSKKSVILTWFQSFKISSGPLDNQTWHTEWKTAPLATEQLCENENQTLEAFVVASRFSAKSDCPVVRQNILMLATAHDCESGLLWLPIIERGF